MRKSLFLSMLAIWFLAGGVAAAPERQVFNEVTDPLFVPYERPIGFTVNLGALMSGTFESRFNLGLARNLALVAVPSYQKTPELPLPIKGEYHLFSFQRFNLGVGLRGHFYKYDSWDGWFIEGLARGGMLWINDDEYVWSVIPSFMVGYTVVYKSGYTVSFGLGVEHEITIKREEEWPDSTAQFKEAFKGITKVPLMGEVSIGWTW